MNSTLEQANLLPLYKEKTLSGECIQLRPPTVKLIVYHDSPIKNLGSIIVFLYHGNGKFKVADSSGHMILGRDQALGMKFLISKSQQSMQNQRK